MFGGALYCWRTILLLFLPACSKFMGSAQIGINDKIRSADTRRDWHMITLSIKCRLICSITTLVQRTGRLYATIIEEYSQ